MLTLQNIAYIHPDKELLFDNVNLTVCKHDKIALIGNNGTGKTTLLKIIARELEPTEGQLKVDSDPYYIPQIFGQYNHLTIAQALQIEGKINALNEITSGNATAENYDLLNDDWTIEDRCKDALHSWHLAELNLSQEIGALSGGQKTKIFLAGISIHQPKLILLDEPSNHLDITGRQLLYDFIQSTPSTLVVVSHDKNLLKLLGTICELSQNGINIYGGNYDLYADQKQIENNALTHHIHSKEKALRKAKEKEREMLERRQKLDSVGKRKQEKAGIPRIMMNTLKNKAENSTAKIRDIQADRIGGMAQELQKLRSRVPAIDKMKFGFANTKLHRGKVLFTATDMNYGYDRTLLWREHLNFQITSGERIALKGLNGSGKTTLFNIISRKLEPLKGTIYRAENKTICIDQDYSLIDNQLNLYEQAQKFNTSSLHEHEIKIRLNRFLFLKEDWDKPCSALSGGERIRLILCCLTISNHDPDMILLDEPTNNLDIQNTEILTAAINEYQGTLIVISHDVYFLKQIHIERVIELKPSRNK